MLDHTTDPVTADSIRTEKLDAPAGATELRIEPVLTDADYLRDIDISCVVRVFWPNGKRTRLPMCFTAGGKSHPYSKRTFPQPLDGARIEVHLSSLDGPIELAARVTAGTAKTIPPRLDLPQTVRDEIEKRGK